MNITREQLHTVVDGFRKFDEVTDGLRTAMSVIAPENQLETIIPFEFSRAVDELLLSTLGSMTAVEAFYWYAYDTQYGQQNTRMIVGNTEHNVTSTDELFDLLTVL
jgi:hypothetical protein